MALLITDPVVFARDTNNRLIFPLRLVSGLEAVAIGIRTRLNMCRGEWFLNLLKGVPYLPTEDGIIVPEREAILGQPFDGVRVRAAMLELILDTPGVLDVPLFRTQFDGAERVLSISWIARTRFGDTPLDTLNKEL